VTKALADFRELVEADLTDASNSTWSTTELDRAIRKALYRYSEVRPQQAIGTLTAAASREYALSTLTGLIGVERVWWPYDSTDPEYPPQWQDFELWDDRTTLFLKSENCPAVGDDPLRVFYTKVQAIQNLDSAAASTYPDEDEEVLVLGATAFAAIQRSRYVVDAVNPSAYTPDLWVRWGQDRLKMFERELERIAQRLLANSDARVAIEWPDLDIED
jgi:hypothetical protein